MDKAIIPQEKVSPEDCKHWDLCSAPICPLEDKIKNLNYIWYPDEEICPKHKYQFIKTQKKIKKKARDLDKYFTLEMLNRNFIVGTGIVGLDPDKEEGPQLKRWMEKHPLKRQISDEEREAIRKRFENAIRRQKS